MAVSVSFFGNILAKTALKAISEIGGHTRKALVTPSEALPAYFKESMSTGVSMPAPREGVDQLTRAAAKSESGSRLDAYFFNLNSQQDASASIACSFA